MIMEEELSDGGLCNWTWNPRTRQKIRGNRPRPDLDYALIMEGKVQEWVKPTHLSLLKFSQVLIPNQRRH